MEDQEEEDNDISDKFKISLIDDSKFDDATIHAKCEGDHESIPRES